MISVCMATFNGGKYIEKQLQCILEQSLAPDEVVICDDGSTDGTIEIIEDFIRKNQLQEKWKLFCNEKKKGYPGNFYYAMGLCRGDIVFLADQDDYWDLDKLRLMTDVMEQNAGIKVLCSTIGLMDEIGKEVSGLLAPSRCNDGKIFPISMERVMYKDGWAGMAMAYRNEFFQGMKARVEHTGVPHDRLLWTLAAQEGTFYQMNRVLSFHRRHTSNTGGENLRISQEIKYDYKICRMKMSLYWLNGLLEEEISLKEEARMKVEQKRDMVADRISNLEQKNIGKVIKHYWKYRKQTRLFSLLCDMGVLILGR